jgi:hypothetical protein
VAVTIMDNIGGFLWKFRGFTHGLSMVIIQLIIDILVGGDWNHGIL